MKRLLISWLGLADLRAPRAPGATGAPGPEDTGAVLRLMQAERFSALWLFDDVGGAEIGGEPFPGPQEYADWLLERLPADHRPEHVEHTSFPRLRNQFRETLARTEAALREIAAKVDPGVELHLHVSPGQPAQQLALILANRTLAATMWATWRPRGDESGVERIEFPVHVTLDSLLAVRDPEREVHAGWHREPLHDGFADILGESRSLRYAKWRANRVAPTPAPVLILGETGTGKELFARAIHAASGRSSGPFCPVNTTGIPETLLEVELFGSERGAFTDGRDRKGLFRAAEGGSLFLDEIGDMPLALQAKLLRALQEKEVRPVGADAAVKVDVRILAATHRDLGELVRRGEFREDLYYRISDFPVRVPPLAGRGHDSVVLARRFLTSECRELGVPLRALTPDAEQELERQPWPGNVRQLQQVARRLALDLREEVDARDVRVALEGESGPPRDEPLTGLAPGEFLTRLARHLDELIDRYDRGECTGLPRIATKRGLRRDPPEGPRLVHYLRQLLHHRALRKANGVRSRVGELVGLGRSLEVGKGDFEGFDVFNETIREAEPEVRRGASA